MEIKENKENIENKSLDTYARLTQGLISKKTLKTRGFQCLCKIDLRVEIKENNEDKVFNPYTRLTEGLKSQKTKKTRVIILPNPH